MKFVRESEVPKQVFEPPYKRVIAPMITPEHQGSKNMWVATCTYPAGYASNPHKHVNQEETFYCIAGKGQIKVDDTVVDIEVGDCVFVEPGETHQVINFDGTEDLKLVSVVAPPFTEEGFKKDHTPTS